jgi:large subunit ribosomal protein L23
VPLQFNKLDLRDYLFHAYNVETTSVRSFINQAEPRKKGNHQGSWYRPRAQKMMIAELVKPFVWPEPPAETEREAFDYDMFKKLNKTRQENMRMQMNPSDIPLRTKVPEPKERKLLKEQAEEFLKSGEWKSGTAGSTKWTEVEEDVDV